MSAARKIILLTSSLALCLFFYLRKSSSSNEETKMENCIFCDIVAGRKPETKIEYETDEIIIFKDIKPASKFHYLAVPKRHIESLRTMNSSDEELLNRLENGMNEFFEREGIDREDATFGFHMPPFITVHHLHLHGIAPRSSMNLIYRQMFRLGSSWFKSIKEAHDYIRKS